MKIGGFKMENIRNKDAQPMMDLVAKKVLDKVKINMKTVLN